MLEVRPPLGPDIIIDPGGKFESFRTFELIYDSTERERKGLSLRRMYLTIVPWSTENPIIMNVRRADPKSVRLAIDQCAEVGFEMVIMTFGSGFNMENIKPDYVAQMKELVDYAHSRNIELGGYSLLASRRIGDDHDAINPETGKPGGAIFGNSPCLCSRWGIDYFENITTFIAQTGLDLLEHDGSYPGDVCASRSHPGHHGLDDSQWKQWKKAPSMGWIFVPLVQYHGGGAAATLEPLSEHLDAYDAHLAQNFGSGIQACYRGPRLYDTDETKALVKQWVDFYKEHRDILDSDIIHVRRPDGRDIDCILHVNPQLKHKGLPMVYNPLGREVKKQLKLPLYYTGLTKTARIREQRGKNRKYRLDREYNVEIPVEIAPGGVTWFVIE